MKKAVTVLAAIIFSAYFFSSFVCYLSRRGNEKVTGRIPLSGKDFKARVVMRLISKGGPGADKGNDNAPGRISGRLAVTRNISCTSSAWNVKDAAFMVYKYHGKDADRWLFVPSISMVRRIAARTSIRVFVRL